MQNYKSLPRWSASSAYTAYLIGFATGGYEVQFFYWAFVPVMVITILHDAKRMLVDAVPPAPVGGYGSGVNLVSVTVLQPGSITLVRTVTAPCSPGAWLVYDARNLVKLRSADFGDPLVRDRRSSGYLVGIGIALIGLYGVMHFHGVV